MLLVCWTILTAVRSLRRDRLPIIDRDLVQLSKDLRAELNRIPALLDDGASAGDAAECARLGLVTATVDQAAPTVPGSDWHHRTQVTAAQDGQAGRSA